MATSADRPQGDSGSRRPRDRAERRNAGGPGAVDELLDLVVAEHQRREAAFQRRVVVLTYAVIGVAALVATHGHAPILTVGAVLGVIGLFHASLVVLEARDGALTGPDQGSSRSTSRLD